MIVAYVSPHDEELREQVSEAAAPAQVVFRDPATFTTADADPLDQIVYVAENARQIRAVYASHAERHGASYSAQVLTLGDGTLEKPPAHLVDRLFKRQQAALHLPPDPASAPQIAPPNLQNRPPTKRELRQHGERQEPEVPTHVSMASAQPSPAMAQATTPTVAPVPATAAPAPKVPAGEKK